MEGCLCRFRDRHDGSLHRPLDDERQRSRKASVSSYFKDPRGFAAKTGGGPANGGEGLRVGRQNADKVREEIERTLRQMPEFPAIRENVKFSITGEGLRIDLLETEQGLFFVSGSAEPSGPENACCRFWVPNSGKMPNPIVLEGHTDARPFRNAEPTARVQQLGTLNGPRTRRAPAFLPLWRSPQTEWWRFAALRTRCRSIRKTSWTRRIAGCRWW